MHYVEFQTPDWMFRYFEPRELACHCCGQLVCDDQALHSLDQLRHLLDRPLRVRSGYRCEEHNRLVGGAARSQHLKGRAFDLEAQSELERAQIVYLARVCGFRGIGLYPSFVHLDTRPDPAWWTG